MPMNGSSTVLARRPRIRTGCATCRIRKVKCGEEKPSCLRCTSTGRKCDGYALDPNADTMVIAGRQQTSSMVKVVSVHQVQGENIQYLEFYYHCGGPRISGKFDHDFWARTVLQMAQSETAVRHALLALSCLAKSESGTLKDARSGLVAVSKQKTMITHYNKALTQLVQRMAEPSYSPEVGLVCCLIFICLESLRGNYDAALTHYKSGLDIISAFKNRSRCITGPAENVRPDMIEEVILPLFTRNIATAIIYGLPSEHVSFNSQYPIGTQECIFNTILDADLSAHNLRNMAFLLIRNLGTKIITQEPYTEEELQELADCIAHHQVWLRALEKFERETNLSEEDVVAATMLKAIHVLMYVFASRLLLQSQTDFDQHLDDFKAIVRYTKAYIDATQHTSSPNAAANFTFTIGIIPGLYLTACRCRCPVTRREALALLERELPREGLWDAQQHAVVARRVIELEERNVDPVTGWPVESARIWSTMIHGEMDDNGRFPVYFVVGHWGEGRGTPPIPPGGILPHDPNGRIWREWFVL
ncbi:hypothetical protein HBH56_156660 [Parastagonospora nodorum]|uniref:Zn(2)-C6 fungal-type domain-containing protein n=2 Tax=Phaeosphaeria nodorum (strain SN15 / ATCC MYA-4574 / FGSC 10173) TaxID=321614 RepID=A0A7U2F2H0_PHANO|nr:hypothetical protein HBH56_156660 [Parastagonospora nodorum]QRC97524.1 hypothetical protein JI435_201010 [Parastagonospora nodorum SN15]KAH3922872.1 hypothetical protein HBH54_218070 [Parastagonospora nodorum]KAH3973364.1 hypothetical protein HBH51_098440 [Parastagonospora nodorum]KAH4002489.1 hypothetical protein HBI10_074760 [Parastagonospora nodorum]